jgi:hypothetical protein
MSKATLDAVKARVDAAEDIDQALLHDTADELRAIFPNAPAHPELLSEPTEAVLRLVDRCLPGWTISLRGTATEPNGHWHCALRESSSSDNDMVIGNGNAPTVSLALLRALVCVAHIRAGSRAGI